MVMTPLRTLMPSLLAAAALAACSTAPRPNALLDQARSDYRAAQAGGLTLQLAPTEMRQAGDALAQAEASFARRDEPAKTDGLAHLSRQRTALAQDAASRKASEATVAQAGAERDQLRLAARTREADDANLAAVVATHEAASSLRLSEELERQADQAQRESATARLQAAAAQDQAAWSQQQAGDAQRRNQALEAQLGELNARQTERGMVVTLGDVLFDSGRAELKASGVRDMDRLGSFLHQYPQRKALIEGYTDSTGSDLSNQALSEHRAQSVMAALIGLGVAREQLSARGYGETHPVADNASADGRQMNRRVEIVLSDENGLLMAR
jgi:outer membrane protein OmpA-like peptidoglycan-associated protein